MNADQALSKLREIVDKNLKAYKSEHIMVEQLFKKIEEGLRENNK